MKGLFLLVAFVLSIHLKAQISYDPDAYAYTAFESISCFAPERASKMWMGDKNGNIQCYDGQSWKQKSWVGSHINDIKIDGSGAKWIATRTKGLYKLDGNTLQKFNMTNSILHTNEIMGLEIGANNKVWLWTNSRIVYSIDASGTWTKYDQTNSPWPNYNILNIQKDYTQKVYFSNGTHKLFSIDQNNNWDSLVLAVPIYKFKFDVVNNLYTLTGQNSRLYKHQNGITVDSSSHVVSALNSSIITKMEFDAQGHLWVTGSGLFEFIGLDSVRFYSKNTHGLSGRDVEAFAVDGLGNKWVSYSLINSTLSIDIFTYSGIIKHNYKQSSLPAKKPTIFSNKTGDLFCYSQSLQNKFFSKPKGANEWIEIFSIPDQNIGSVFVPIAHFHEAKQELWVSAYNSLYKFKNGVLTCDTGAFYNPISTSGGNYFLETPDHTVILVNRAGFWSNLETQPVFNAHNFSLHINVYENTVGLPFYDHNKHLWIPIANMGYCKYNGTQWSRVDVATLGIPDLGTLVLNMMQAADSTYWLSNEYGLFEMKNGVVKKYDSTNSILRNAVIFGLCQDGDNNIWFYNGQFTTPPSINALLRIRNDGVWEEFSMDSLPFDDLEMKIPDVDAASRLFIGLGFGLVYLNPKYPLNSSVFNQNEKTLIIYPNPASSECWIANGDTNEWVEVFDMQSKLMIRRRSTKLELSHLAPGAYIVKNGKLSTRLLIRR